MSKPELFFSLDVETDGPIPIRNSMLSFGVVAIDSYGKVHGTFQRNLDLYPGAQPNPDTAKFWAENKSAWDACRKNTVDPKLAMKEFVDWVNEIGQGYEKVCVAYPAGFDFTFLYVYMIDSGVQSPFSFSCLDIKTFASAVLNNTYRNSTKKNWPNNWKNKAMVHTHEALDDALEQGLSFIKMLCEDSSQISKVETTFFESLKTCIRR